MYHFPNLDDKTCSIMISELERDIKNGLFYEPSSMKPEYIASYKLLLRKYFEIGHVEGLEKALTSSFFKVKDKNGRKVSSNIAKMIAFSDFNRYYVRAILVKAIEENKSVCIYRAKQAINERTESKKMVTQSFRMHLKRIGVNSEIYELIKLSLKMCLGDEQTYHKEETERINQEIEECKEVLKKMYLDQLNNVLEYDLWVNLKNDHEVKLSRLSAELQRHTKANTNYLDTGLKILDLCSKASLPAAELSAEEVAQIIREVYLNATVKDIKG